MVKNDSIPLYNFEFNCECSIVINIIKDRLKLKQYSWKSYLIRCPKCKDRYTLSYSNNFMAIYYQYNNSLAVKTVKSRSHLVW